MARGYLQHRIRASCYYRCTFLVQQSNARRVSWTFKDELHMIFVDPKPALARALLTMTSGVWRMLTANSQSRIKTCCMFSPFFCMLAIVMFVPHSFDSFGNLSKRQIFMRDALAWAPAALAAWILEVDQRPGLVRLRENRACSHEVAVNLIEGKRQELKNSASQRDVLTLLGLSRVPS
jgi:hypothetical protein